MSLKRLFEHTEFVTSALKTGQYPPARKWEFVFCGRSNVGKSSLLNRLAGIKNLAKISSKPGKTRLINFFLVNGARPKKCFLLVDLPGYGYAHAPRSARDRWGRAIEEYFEKREAPRTVFHLVDIRHKPSKLDITLQQWLKDYNIPHVIVATKADKISRGVLSRHLKVIREALELGPKETIIPFSVVNGTGQKETIKYIEEVMKHGHENH